MIQAKPLFLPNFLDDAQVTDQPQELFSLLAPISIIAGYKPVDGQT
jgi:hypothetical protein